MSVEKLLRVGAFPFTNPGYAAAETATANLKDKERKENPFATLRTIMIVMNATRFEVWVESTQK